jgi:hypothetical protein
MMDGGFCPRSLSQFSDCVLFSNKIEGTAQLLRSLFKQPMSVAYSFAAIQM